MIAIKLITNLLILQTGIVVHENKSITHRQYCLKASLDKVTNESKLDMVMCYESADQHQFNILPYGE